MNHTKIISSLLLSSFASTLLVAGGTSNDKIHELKNNGILIYNAQKSVDSFHDMFTQGDIYGRLRSNNFYFAYSKDDSSHDTQLVGSAGASFVFKSASYKHFDMTLGLYGSQSFFNDAVDPIDALKPAKDTLSRYNYVNTGSKSMAVIGQANIAYTYSQTKLIVGRQLVETFYTKSNDTKMIPNTFDGAVVNSTDLKDTQLTLAYLQKQKLRDHTDAHSVLMYGDENLSSHRYPQWSQNDDGAMHRGLTYSALKAAGKATDAPLIVLDAQNSSLQNTKLNFSSYLVPELLSQIMAEVNYKLQLNGFSITTGLRYIQQFDNGAGKVGGASLYKIGLDGYKDANSLDGGMLGARIVTKFRDYKINLAYTGTFDKADLVTPWRGFPTAGYTRSMGMYNWRANVKSYRLELVKGANAKGIYTTPFIQTSVLYIDGDQSKAETENLFYYAGLIQNLPAMPQLQYRLRLGWRDFIGDSSSVSDYLDSRFELNYLF